MLDDEQEHIEQAIEAIREQIQSERNNLESFHSHKIS